MTTNQALDNLISQKGYSFEEVATKMGMTRQRLHQLRQEPYKMNVMHMEKLADIIGVEFEDVYKIHKSSREG